MSGVPSGPAAGGYRPGEAGLVVAGPDFGLTRFPAPARWATRGAFAVTLWEDVVGAFRQPELWPGGGSVAVARDRLPAWSFARYREDTRVVLRDEALARRETELRVEEVHGLVVEYEDEPTVDAAHLERWWSGIAFLAHTTGFHEQPMGDKPPGPRWRVLVPFSRPVTRQVAERVGAWVRHPRRDVGIVAEATLDPVRAVELPAVAPGGYRWTGGAGEALDPDLALGELDAWEELDGALRARSELAGTPLEVHLARFAARLENADRRPVFPVPGGPSGPAAARPFPAAPAAGWGALAGLLGGLWPGRTAVVRGRPGSGRSALALQLAAAAAAAGHPVLVVETRADGDEVVARLLAARSEGVSPWELLRGEVDADEVRAAARRLGTDLATLYVWTPLAPERTRDGLLHRIASLARAHGDRPPLVVLDGASGWPGAVQEVLADAARAGALGPDWAGAATLLVADADAPCLGSAAALAEAFAGGAALPVDPADADAHVVVLVATDPPGPADAGRRATVGLARNHEGPRAAAALRFDPVAGRFCA